MPLPLAVPIVGGLVSLLGNLWTNSEANQRQNELIKLYEKEMEKQRKKEKDVYSQNLAKFAGFEKELTDNKNKAQAYIEKLLPVFEKRREDLAKRQENERLANDKRKGYLFNLVLDQFKPARINQGINDSFRKNYGVDIKDDWDDFDELLRANQRATDRLHKDLVI